jgi:prepilin-type N-terminal cleavage/methylation domain-containing protein
MNQNNKSWFTLVELIVVITILAILATIGYISFLWYASAARDSSRIHNISIITRALEYHKLKTTKLFTPDDAIPISLSGTVVWYQWDMWKASLWTIWITEWWTDPLDWEFYTYFLSWNKAQILTLLENPKENALAKTFHKTYADNSDRYPFFKWNGLWLILEADNTPIHRATDVIAQWEFDILNPTFAAREVQSLYNNESFSTMPALYIWWQLSLNSQTRESQECPQHFIPVPWNEDLGQPDFCIGQYEASVVWNDHTLTYDTLPWVTSLFNIVNDHNGPDCRWNGDNYHMMTMMEWLTIVRNIEQVDSNWSNGIVWSGHIIGWNNGNNTTWFDSWWQLITWPTGNTIQDNMRQLTLSNWEKIWDLIWNKWEVVKTLNLYIFNDLAVNEVASTIATSWTMYKNVLDLFPIQWTPSNSTYYSWWNITDENFKTMFWPKTTQMKDQWIGSVRRYNNYVTVVWGDYNESTAYENGLYSIVKTSTMNASNIGTRCAYSY